MGTTVFETLVLMLQTNLCASLPHVALDSLRVVFVSKSFRDSSSDYVDYVVSCQSVRLMLTSSVSYVDIA